jgi:ribonuclease HI
MKRLDELLLALAGGASIGEAWRRAGFASRIEAQEALRDLAATLRPAGRERAGAKSTGVKGTGAKGTGAKSAGGKKPLSLIIYVDGASRGNPGPSSVGAVAYLPGGDELTSVSKSIGRATNNVAEYMAVLEGLKLAGRLSAREVEIRLDSELVACQLNGEYRIKNGNLQAIARSVTEEAARFEACKYVHIRRSENARADMLANEALDREASDP